MSGTDAKIAGFLVKAMEMVSDPNYGHLISWSPDGKSFVVHNKEVLARDVLPVYFKHNNFSSMIRQLNMYGFRKIGDPQHWIFQHEYFRRGEPDQLKYIKRKAVRKPPANSSAAAKRPTDKLDGRLVMNNQRNIELNMRHLRTEISHLNNRLQALHNSMESMGQFLKRKFPADFEAAQQQGTATVTAVASAGPSNADIQPPPPKKRKKNLTVQVPPSVRFAPPVLSTPDMLGEQMYGPIPGLGLTPNIKSPAGLMMLSYLSAAEQPLSARESATERPEGGLVSPAPGGSGMGPPGYPGAPLFTPNIGTLPTPLPLPTPVMPMTPGMPPPNYTPAQATPATDGARHGPGEASHFVFAGFAVPQAPVPAAPASAHPEGT